jgi:hypothetical protein
VKSDFTTSQRLSDSDIPPAKAQRRQIRRRGINIITNDFHPYFPAFASLREIIRVSVEAAPRCTLRGEQNNLNDTNVPDKWLKNLN